MSDIQSGESGDDGTVSFSPIGSVSGTFGPVFVGAYISVGLYGLLLQQAYKYYTVYRSDRRWLRSLVTVALILETAVSVFHIHLTYFYFVANYGNPLAFFEDVWSLSIFSTISACIMITCQSFHVTRLMLLGTTKFIYLPVGISCLLMTGAMGVSIAVTVVAFRGLTIYNFQTLLNLLLTYNAVASGGDVILTASVTYALHRCRTGMDRTDTLINRLIMYTISTGLLTTVFNILSAILIRVLGMDNWAWLGTMMIAERLYSNSLMAALNSRTFGRQKRGGHPHGRRPSNYFGTAVQPSTVRFDRGLGSSATDEEVELRVSQMRSGLQATSGSTLVTEKDGIGTFDGSS